MSEDAQEKLSEDFMGTRAAAEARFMSACDFWIATRQPQIDSRRAIKMRDLQEREARFQLANAAIHLAWFMRNGIQ